MQPENSSPNNDLRNDVYSSGEPGPVSSLPNQVVPPPPVHSVHIVQSNNSSFISNPFASFGFGLGIVLFKNQLTTIITGILFYLFFFVGYIRFIILNPRPTTCYCNSSHILK